MAQFSIDWILNLILYRCCSFHFHAISGFWTWWTQRIGLVDLSSVLSASCCVSIQTNQTKPVCRGSDWHSLPSCSSCSPSHSWWLRFPMAHQSLHCLVRSQLKSCPRSSSLLPVYLLKRLRPWRPVGCPPAAANVAFILGIAAFCESGLYHGLSWWSEENQCEAAAMSLSVEMKGQINDYNWMVLEFNEIKKAGFLNQIVAYFGWYSVEFGPLL